MTIKGYYIPSMIWENLNVFMSCLIAAIVAIIFIRIYAKKIQEKEGKQLPVLYISLALITILPLLSFLIGGVTLDFEMPKLKQLATTSFIFEGGVALPPELIALVLALSLYLSLIHI